MLNQEDIYQSEYRQKWTELLQIFHKNKDEIA